YNAPTSVTIPAGKVIDSLPISGLFAGYPTGRVDKLDIAIVGGNVPSSTFNDTFRLVMQKYCPPVLSDLVGSYTNCNDYQGTIDNNGLIGGPYTATVSNPVSTGPTSGTIVIKNLAFILPLALGYPPYSPTDPAVATGITVSLDWSKPPV